VDQKSLNWLSLCCPRPKGRSTSLRLFLPAEAIRKRDTTLKNVKADGIDIKIRSVPCADALIIDDDEMLLGNIDH